MIPIHLALSGFLSYRDPVQIDFTSIDLACIAGPNGAGKSSLLDAITWALFGQARKRDDGLINSAASTAEVSLVFAYENNLYRVQRIKPRDKTALLEFHILQAAGSQQEMLVVDSDQLSSAKWKPLTERTLRETEALIERTLRMDYETFTNASFFLQGKADQFTQQRSSDRKRILSSILGLEVWEEYRQNAAERRKQIENEITALDGRLKEIVDELDEEAARKQRLAELEQDLARLSEDRTNQEEVVANFRKLAAALEQQQNLVETLARQLEISTRQTQTWERSLAERLQEREAYADILSRASQVEADYKSWQEKRAELERIEQAADRFREHEKRREAPRTVIQTERARLEQEMQTLQSQAEAINALQPEQQQLGTQIETIKLDLQAAETRLAHRKSLEEELRAAQQSYADARSENIRLKEEMLDLEKRIIRLQESEVAECPFCGQPIGPQERPGVVARMEAQGKEMGDRYRANLSLFEQVQEQVQQLEEQITGLSDVDVELRGFSQNLAALDGRFEHLQTQQTDWDSNSAPRLHAIRESLEQEAYASEARKQLAEIDAELVKIGYDTTVHDAARQSELQGRESEAAMRGLEKAQATLAPLEREIAGLQSQIANQQTELTRLQDEHQKAAEALAANQAQAPDIHAAEQRLYSLQEQENNLRQEMGAALQKVQVLDDLKKRRKKYETEREAMAGRVGQYKQLERAFGKDGVPALLIEQALPEIETRANDLLERLSEGRMSVRFVTQEAYKDKRRDDLKETLDIQISDNAGSRDYEMFSGGEAFRVNFAIRLALSEVLAQRAGARLQTLVIDEGFGSQDAQGRQRLIEAINMVREDFAKVLVITHIDELKDAFPHRIEVEKTERGSEVRII